MRTVDTIYYLDSTISFYHPLKKFIKNGTINGFANIREGIRETVSFKKSEIKSFQTSISNYSPQELPPNLFEASVRVSDLPLHAIGPPYKHYYLLSPVFFNTDKSKVVFRLCEMITRGAGYDFVFIYTKQKGSWQRRVIIQAGAW